VSSAREGREAGRAPIPEIELWRYVDQELAAGERETLDERLAASPEDRARLESCERESRLYSDALQGERLESRIAERVSEALRAERRSIEVPHGARRLRLVLLAAIVLLAPFLTFFILDFASPDVHQLGSYRSRAKWALVRVEGGRNFETVSGAESFGLRPGMVFDVPVDGELEIVARFDDEGERSSRLVVRGPGRLAVSSDATPAAFAARLALGELEVEVDPLASGESFILQTPDAAVRVVGTRFVVRVSDGETRLGVLEGKVELRSLRREGDAPTLAREGSWLRVRAEPGAAPEPVEPEAPAARPRLVSPVEAPAGGAADATRPGIDGAPGTDPDDANRRASEAPDPDAAPSVREAPSAGDAPSDEDSESPPSIDPPVADPLDAPVAPRNRSIPGQNDLDSPVTPGTPPDRSF